MPLAYQQTWQNGSAREVARRLQRQRQRLRQQQQQQQQQRPQLLSLEVHRQHRLRQQLPQPRLQLQLRLRLRLRERLLRHQQRPRSSVVARLVRDAPRQSRASSVRPRAAYSSPAQSAICRPGAAPCGQRLPHGLARHQGLGSAHSRHFAACHAEDPRRRVRSARLGRL